MSNSNPCLLVIDVQQGFLDPYWGKCGDPHVVGKISAAIGAWRNREWPLVHVKHCSTDSKSPLFPNSPGNDFMDESKPLRGETVIEKNVNSAFIGTELEQLLRKHGVADLVLVGFTSDHCVSTSARMAANLGFGVTVLSDATATFDRTGPDGVTYPAETVHRVSLASLHGEFARVVDLQTYLATLAPVELKE